MHSSSDLEKNVRLKYLTQDDPLGRHDSVLDRGDVIPLDWRGKEAWASPTATPSCSA